MSTGGYTAAAAAFKALAALAALLGSACTSIATDSRAFAGTRWQVVAINGAPTPPVGGYLLEFTGGRIGGRFGCNSFGGFYRVQQDLLSTAEIASTAMGCPEPAATHEKQGLAVLGQPMRLQWQSGTRLTLVNGAGTIALERIP